jgi:hypothetical protein
MFSIVVAYRITAYGRIEFAPSVAPNRIRPIGMGESNSPELHTPDLYRFKRSLTSSNSFFNSLINLISSLSSSSLAI